MSTKIPYIMEFLSASYVSINWITSDPKYGWLAAYATTVVIALFSDSALFSHTEFSACH